MISLNQLLPFFIVIPATIAGIMFYRKKYLRLFFIYLVTALCFEFAFFYTALRGENKWLLDIFCLVEYLLIASALLSFMHGRNKKLKYISVLFIGLIICSLAFLKLKHNPHLKIQNITLVIISAWSLIQLFKEDLEYPLLADGRFWIITGVLIYFSCVTILYTLLAFVGEVSVRENGKYFLYVFSTVNIISYLMYSIGYLCKYPHQISRQ